VILCIWEIFFFTEKRNPFSNEPLDEWFKGPTSEFKISLMLLIQNYQLNRQKSDPQQVQYNFGLNTNPAELSGSGLPPPYGGNAEEFNQANVSSSSGNPPPSQPTAIEAQPKTETQPVEKPPVQPEQKKRRT